MIPEMNRKVCMLCASIVNNSITGEKNILSYPCHVTVNVPLLLNVTLLNACVTFAKMEMPDIPLS